MCLKKRIKVTKRHVLSINVVYFNEIMDRRRAFIAFIDCRAEEAASYRERFRYIL